MRVTHIITRLIIGGAQENTVASVLGLQQKPELEVQLLSGPTSGPEGSLESAFARSPALLSIVPDLVRPVHPWKDTLAFRDLTQRLRHQQPDLVHTHSGKAGILGRLAAARAGVPVIVHTVHGPSFGPFQGPLPNLVFRSAERLAARVTTHFVVVADAMKQQYLAAGIGAPERYTTIRSGFDLEPFLSARNDPSLRARLGIGPEAFVVGKIARLFRKKGHEDLLTVAPELVRSCPQMKFLLVGDGTLRPQLESRARALGVQDHVIFVGLVRPDEVSQFVGIMDCLVHLSTREGLARALPQALAAARPVVAYDCDGASEICLENETGFLVRPGDLEGLRDRLLRLAKDRPLRNRLGQHGQQFVRDHFSVAHMVDSLHQLYLQLLCPRALTASPL
jgi:glycosyltransferase involved in cell wall biosynthesis